MLGREAIKGNEGIRKHTLKIQYISSLYIIVAKIMDIIILQTLTVPKLNVLLFQNEVTIYDNLRLTKSYYGCSKRFKSSKVRLSKPIVILTVKKNKRISDCFSCCGGGCFHSYQRSQEPLQTYVDAEIVSNQLKTNFLFQAWVAPSDINQALVRKVT